jgi:DNA-binding transcriptional LysR family regulator
MRRIVASRFLSVQYIIQMPSIGFLYMTPSQLRAFHLVAESGSFSAAARASGLSQPNLSGQVTALEKAYGVRLFDRRGRTVAPTETGRQLHGVTTRLFALQDEARALLAGEQALTRGHLRIAADSAHHVVPIMAALRKRAEGLTFALSIDNSAVVLDRLLRHEADVAVMAKSVSDPPADRPAGAVRPGTPSARQARPCPACGARRPGGGAARARLDHARSA